MHGEIKKVFLQNGYGFITTEEREKDLFFHISGLVPGLDFKELKEGQKVTFEDIIDKGRGDTAIGVSLE